MYLANKQKRMHANKAFTLIEAMIALVLVGFAIVSLMVATGSFTRANAAGINLSTAEFLVEQIRELTTMTEFDNLLSDFDNAAFSPPINADRQVLNDLDDFSQQITVENVSPADFEQVVPDYTSDFIRITTKILLNGSEISSAVWLKTRH